MKLYLQFQIECVNTNPSTIDILFVNTKRLWNASIQKLRAVTVWISHVYLTLATKKEIEEEKSRIYIFLTILTTKRVLENY